MMTRAWLLAALLGGLLPASAMPGESTRVSARYKALKCPSPSLGTTWAILQHDGANRQVEPYLSSLGQGEAGTGVATSPAFVVDAPTITCTLCGHDGQGGGRGQNYIALLDAGTEKTLRKTAAPGSDAMVERTWDVTELKGTEVRIEVHDGDTGGAFAWMGVGRIDAGPALHVDFRQGLPKNWQLSLRPARVRDERLTDGIPFQRNAAAFTVIPNTGSLELTCGFSAKRLFFLGCTVSGGRPLTTYGGIEVHYRTASPDVFPLMCGYTLDGRNKLLSTSPAIHLHRSADPYQHYLVIEPQPDVIEKIRLVANPDRGPIPVITAITCETTAENDRLMRLPDCEPSVEETRWIESHAVSTDVPRLGQVVRVIRAAHKVPVPAAPRSISFRKQTLDEAFRSEGVAVADFNGDGRPDIAAGNMLYTAPDWQPNALFGKPIAFPRSGYSDAFLCFADDVNRDGALDMVVVGFPGQQTYWWENPTRSGAPWTKHLAVERTGNESPWFGDVDGDGRRELVFMDGSRCSFATPGSDPTRPWDIRPIAGPDDPGVGHGLGIGDINGDGRTDVLVPAGWWEGPQVSRPQPWTFHPANLFGGAQLCVWDFDGDGDNDVLGSSAHGYGISWCEQTPTGWQTHAIDDSMSQTHALHLADVDGDGLRDFVTGKRFWAHNGHDPGSYEPAGLYWFELKRTGSSPEWTKHLIDVDSGCGLHIAIVDVNGDDRLDLVTSNKKGVHYFQQVREPRAARAE